jgi:transcriptional regulator with XRE-family HTH domain
MKKDTMATINARLKIIRQALKLSQRDFSKGIYLSQSSYAKMELGEKVNSRIIELVSIKYGVNKDYLVTGKGDMFNTRPNVKLEQIITIFNELDDVFQEYILTQIKEILKVQKKTKKTGE